MRRCSCRLAARRRAKVRRLYCAATDTKRSPFGSPTSSPRRAADDLTTASVDATAWHDVRLSNCTFAVPTPHLIALPICVAPSIHLTIVARRARSQCVVLLALISVDRRSEKDDRRETKVPIREDGKIKACGTTARDWSRFHCLHIGLSTAATVPRIHNEARQPGVRASSIGGFSQCHQGSFASSRFSVNLRAWLAPTMIHAFAPASAAREVGITGGCWRQRRSSARFLVPAPSHDHPCQGHLSGRGASPICRPSATEAQRSRAGGQPHHEAGRRRSQAHAVSWSRRAT